MTTEQDLLAGLNPQQREAASCTDAPLIIIAGPGTGKTRTLTYRIAYLIVNQGVAPENILAITFTNKAAEEMKARLTHLLGADLTGQIVVKTFHAFGVMLLHETSEQIGLSPNFAICSKQDQLTLLKQLYPDLSERDLNQHLADISTAKNQLLGPDAVDASLREVYQNYQRALAENRLLDFDDLIFKVVQLLDTHPGLLDIYRARFHWISVDEHQDINHAQYRLLRLLSGPETNICVIGDPDQAIYGFRGANREYFLKFSQDFPTAKMVHLNQNYRSTQLILDASDQVIEKSRASERIKIWSDFVDKTKIDSYQAPTDKAEAEYIVHQIEKMIGGLSYFSIDSSRVTDEDETGHTFADFAVLYRLGAQSHLLIEAFQRSGIPYQTAGQRPLSDYKEVRLILACLWFLDNPSSTFHLEGMLSNEQMQEIIPFLNGLNTSSLPVPDLIEKIYQFIAGQAIFHVDEESNGRIQQLKRRAIPFADRLKNFLESMVLQKETDLYDPRADRVALMTLHASKGLEFPVVFIVGCEESLLPYQPAGKPFDVEEERRLFYVGMTRAQQKLILTYAKTRFLFGQKCSNKPSRFVNDIEETLKEIKKMASRKSIREEPDNIQLKLF